MIELPTVYGTLALSRIGLQVGTSTLERRRPSLKLPTLPKATLVVPVYNEPIVVFAKAAKSFAAQDYPDFEVIVVDDGSSNGDQIKKVSEYYGLQYIRQDNAGKREAMYAAFQRMHRDSQIVLTADSDTVWEPAVARELVCTLLSRPGTGAVTGDVAVSNEADSLLTRLISIRYHLAFLHERASQSFFGSVSCVSGPIGAYRRDLIDRIRDDFINQRFLGKQCTYGDDRHLTSLILNEGYHVRFSPKAKCYTEVPNRFWNLVRQQTRWSKSYWREILWQVRVLPKHGLFMWYDWAISLGLPFILLFTIASHFSEGLHTHLIRILLLLATITIMGLVRVAEPLIRTRRPIFLLFVLYAFMYMAVMLPSKFYALATLRDKGWGTR